MTSASASRLSRRLRRRDRCAYRLQLLQLRRVGRLVALSHPKLDALQIVRHVGDLDGLDLGARTPG
jgi:hypothetical protein